MYAGPHATPKPGSRPISKRLVVVLSLVLGGESGLFTSLNFSASSHEFANVFPIVLKAHYGWPATFRGAQFERGVGTLRMHRERRERTFRSYFDGWALALNVGFALSAMTLTAIVVAAGIRRRFSLRTLLAVMLLVGLLCALFMAAGEIQEPPGW